MKTIDTSFLYKPTPEQPGESFNNEGWGYLDVDDMDILDAFRHIEYIVQPKVVVEIGMFAGHSTLLMLEYFMPLKKLTSYDPNHVAAASAVEIIKRYPKFSFYNEPIWGNESNHENVDLIFVDGDHSTKAVIKDVRSCVEIQPRYILFDNVEHTGVSTALNRLGLYNKKYKPNYFFYTNHHKDNVKPGIMMLIDMTAIDDKDWLDLERKVYENDR